MGQRTGLASIEGDVLLRWLGVSTFEVRHAGRVLLIDPYLSRAADARPAAPSGSGGISHADAILVTHGHPEHYGDVPALARRLGATVYVPGDLERRHALRSRLLGRPDDAHRWRSWSENRRVDLAGLIVQAFPVHREEWRGLWLRRAAAHVLRGRLDPRMVATALRLSAHDPLGSAVAIHVTHAATGTSVFFFGALTRQVYSLPDHPLPVDILALPATQDSDWWADDATGLVSLLRPRVVMVHHHDDWCPPLSAPVDVEGFTRALQERCSVQVFVPPFASPFTLNDVLAVAKA